MESFASVNIQTFSGSTCFMFCHLSFVFSYNGIIRNIIFWSYRDQQAGKGIGPAKFHLKCVDQWNAAVMLCTYTLRPTDEVDHFICLNKNGRLFRSLLPLAYS